MITSPNTKKPLFVFSKWSRKSYAVFASLNRIVNVARLSIDITQVAGNKQLSPIQFFTEDTPMDHLLDLEVAYPQYLEFNNIEELDNSANLYTDIKQINNNHKPKAFFLNALGFLIYIQND